MVTLLWFISARLFAVCKEAQEPIVPQILHYAFVAPAHFPAPVYESENNPIKKEGFELGRKLFYDLVLSRGSTVSYSSCHQQFVAFAHSDHVKSHGIDNQVTLRNSPGLFNLAWQKDFFWDGGVNHTELVSLAPIANPLEMDEKMVRVVYKLNRIDRYKGLFQKAFGKDTVDSQQILNAEELEGLRLFREKCSACHSEELFTDLSFRNNGLNTSFVNDKGREHITTRPSDTGQVQGAKS